MLRHTPIPYYENLFNQLNDQGHASNPASERVLEMIGEEFVVIDGIEPYVDGKTVSLLAIHEENEDMFIEQTVISSKGALYKSVILADRAKNQMTVFSGNVFGMVMPLNQLIQDRWEKRYGFKLLENNQ